MKSFNYFTVKFLCDVEVYEMQNYLGLTEIASFKNACLSTKSNVQRYSLSNSTCSRSAQPGKIGLLDFADCSTSAFVFKPWVDLINQCL